jgi:hypothetical protein
MRNTAKKGCGCLLWVALAVLAGAFGGKLVAQDVATVHHPGTYYYTDLPADSPHDHDIGFAREAGIARGYSATEYGPEWNVPREQMATFQMREFAAGVVFALALHNAWANYWSQPIPDRPEDQRTMEDMRAMVEWAAELVEHQDASRVEDAIGGPAMYGDIAAHLRRIAECCGG